MRRPTFFFFAALAGVPFAACGGAANVQPAGGSSSTGSTHTTSMGGSTTTTTSGAGGEDTCPSALLCGTPAVCCAPGAECVAGACVPGCGGAPSFGPGGYNTYRVSEQGNGTFNAPDLAVDLSVLTIGCPTSLTLRATVHNVGSLGIEAGLLVEAFAGHDPSGTALGQATTKTALLPGQTEDVDLAVQVATLSPPYAFFVRVDGASAVDECDESNNGRGMDGVLCPAVD